MTRPVYHGSTRSSAVERRSPDDRLIVEPVGTKVRSHNSLTRSYVFDREDTNMPSSRRRPVYAFLPLIPGLVVLFSLAARSDARAQEGSRPMACKTTAPQAGFVGEESVINTATGQISS